VAHLLRLKLNLPRRGTKRLPERIRKPLEVPVHPNDTWSADFMADSPWSGRRFRTFNVMDDDNRQAQRIVIDTSLPAKGIIGALDELIEVRGKTKRLRMDNGPEFVNKGLADGRSAMALP
jgi:putative transposase